MENDAKKEQNESELGPTDSSARDPAVPSSGHPQSRLRTLDSSMRNVMVPSQQPHQSIPSSKENSSWLLLTPSSDRHQLEPGFKRTGSRKGITPASEHSQAITGSMDSSWQTLMIPSSESHQSGPSGMESSTRNMFVPASEHHQSVTGSKERRSRQLTVPSSEYRQSGPGVIESSTRNMFVPASEHSQALTGSMDSSWQNLMIPSSESQWPGPSGMESSTRNMFAPASEHHQSVTGSNGSSSRQLTVPSSEYRQSGPGVIESSTRNMFVPVSEHSQAITGSMDSSWQTLMIPSSESQRLGPSGMESSTRNMFAPASEHHQSVTGSNDSSSRQLTVPSSEYRQSGPGVIESSTRNVIIPASERRQVITGSIDSGSQQLTIPSSKRRQSGPGIIGSSTRNVIVPGSKHLQSRLGKVKSSSRNVMIPSWVLQPPERPPMGSSKRALSGLPPESWAAIVGGVRSSARETEHRKSLSPSSRGSISYHKSGTKDPSAEHHRATSRSTSRRSVAGKLALAHRGTLMKAIARPRAQHHRYELTRPLILITMITSFGSSFQLGYNIWVITHPSALIEEFYNSTYHLKNNVSIDRVFLSVLYNLTLAIFAIGGLVGSLLFSPIVDKFGRKGALMLNNFVSVGSSVLMGLSATIRAYEYTLFSRMVNGICSGIFACAVPLYLAEVAPKNLRAGIMTVSRVFVVIGMLVCQIFSLPRLLGNMHEWPILLSIPGGLALFQVIILPFFPESPRYLLIQKRKEESARQALQMLRCQINVDQEIEELYQEDQAEKAEKVMSGLKIICFRGLRWQVVSVIILMSGQHLSGFSAAQLLSERIYMTMSLYSDDIQYIGMVSTFSLLLSLLVVTYIIDTVGRRILILLGFGMCSILCVLLTMTLELQHTMSWMAYISSILVFIFFIGHIIGPGSVPQVIVAELFLQSSRSTAFSLGGFVYWFVVLVTGLIFRQIETEIGSYSFLLFWPLCFGTFFYIFKIIPETKGKTFLDIRRLMSVHVNVARKIQVQGPAPNTKTPVKKGKKGKLGQKTGKKKKRKKSVPAENSG